MPANIPTTEYLDTLWAKAPKNALKIQTSMLYGEESKYVTVRPDPAIYKRIEIVHITDVQFGHRSCNIEKFLEYRDWILSKKNRFVLFGGDMVDAATALSIASPYENTEEPQGQVYRFCELAMPMRHRIIGYVGGNHERRGVKTFGDLGKLISMLLKVPYSSGKQFVDVHYGQHKPYKISLWHGGTGSKTKGAKAQMIHRFMTQGDSDLYCVGHLHDAMMIGDVRSARDGKNGIKAEKFAGVMSSSFLDHWGTYAEVAGMPIGDTQMWRLILEPSGHSELTLR
jgi:predicted MPP superfamily phosphohydrolase